jgi:hypothetical protein
MIKSGIIEQEPMNGECLLSIDGTDIPFSVDRTWKSTERPKPGLLVEVEFDMTGSVTSVFPIAVPDDSGQHPQLLAAARDRSVATVHSVIERVGMSTVLATGALAFSWFILATITYDAGFLGRINFTFWHLLAFLGSSSPIEAMQTMRDNGCPGLYGLGACLVLACPFASAVWNDSRVALGGVLPLVFLLVVAFEARRCFLQSCRALRRKSPMQCAKKFSRASRSDLAPTFRLSQLYISATSVCADSSRSAPFRNHPTLGSEVAYEFHRQSSFLPPAPHSRYGSQRSIRRGDASLVRSHASLVPESSGTAQAESQQGQGSDEAGRQTSAAACSVFNRTSAGRRSGRQRCSSCHSRLGCNFPVNLERCSRPRWPPQWNRESISAYLDCRKVPAGSDA